MFLCLKLHHNYLLKKQSLKTLLLKLKHMNYIILFILFSTTLFSQNYKIEYAVKVLEDEALLKSQYTKELYTKAMEGASNLKYTLKCNDSISLFYLNEALEIDSYATKSAIARTSVDKNTIIFNDTIYSNNRDGLFKESTYLIKKPLNKNWVLTTETKNINDFLCYKATNEYIVVNPKGTFRHPVTAWYCPQISISHGPNGYGGLPGLILEIQIRKILFGAVKIEKTQEKISFNLKGEEITYENYTQKFIDFMNTKEE
jgi:GLPGLI family protein